MGAKKLGNILKEARHERGSTLQAIEAATKLSKSYVSLIERGKITNPSPARLRILADYFKFSVSELKALAEYEVPENRKNSPSVENLIARLDGFVLDKEIEVIVAVIKLLRTTE